MYKISKNYLKNPSKFKNELITYITNIRNEISENYKLEFDIEELGNLLLSACRSNDFNVISQEKKKMFLNESQVQKWISEKLIPNTIILRLDDEDIIRLLLFCLQITYKMFEGGTKATVTQKGFRERRRTFESILVDQFVGKLGEIFIKKFLEGNFSGAKINLDWEISTEIEEHKNDILNSNKNVSIKSSPSLSGIWAEADKGYDYGIMVKCSVPQQPILQFFIEVCGFSKLLDFAENKIPPQDNLFKEYLGDIRKRIKKYKCGEMQALLKGFICGYFKTSDYSTIEKGTNLPYLGVVKEERYLVRINELKWTKEDWGNFLREVGIL